MQSVYLFHLHDQEADDKILIQRIIKLVHEIIKNNQKVEWTLISDEGNPYIQLAANKKIIEIIKNSLHAAKLSTDLISLDTCLGFTRGEKKGSQGPYQDHGQGSDLLNPEEIKAAQQEFKQAVTNAIKTISQEASQEIKQELATKKEKSSQETSEDKQEAALTAINNSTLDTIYNNFVATMKKALAEKTIVNIICTQPPSVLLALYKKLKANDQLDLLKHCDLYATFSYNTRTLLKDKETTVDALQKLISAFRKVYVTETVTATDKNQLNPETESDREFFALQEKIIKEAKEFPLISTIPSAALVAKDFNNGYLSLNKKKTQILDTQNKIPSFPNKTKVFELTNTTPSESKEEKHPIDLLVEEVTRVVETYDLNNYDGYNSTQCAGLHSRLKLLSAQITSALEKRLKEQHALEEDKVITENLNQLSVIISELARSFEAWKKTMDSKGKGILTADCLIGLPLEANLAPLRPQPESKSLPWTMDGGKFGIKAPEYYTTWTEDEKSNLSVMLPHGFTVATYNQARKEEISYKNALEKYKKEKSSALENKDTEKLSHLKEPEIPLLVSQLYEAQTNFHQYMLEYHKATLQWVVDLQNHDPRHGRGKMESIITNYYKEVEKKHKRECSKFFNSKTDTKVFRLISLVVNMSTIINALQKADDGSYKNAFYSNGKFDPEKWLNYSISLDENGKTLETTIAKTLEMKRGCFGFFSPRSKALDEVREKIAAAFASQSSVKTNC